ncbi:hypothetical protein FEM48_Zijuj12G0018900 [Ziziphus jujuba var. spinosa]|uniref:Uncharacterized protein n=1 Tax=Ziziphus jujuba var. spinosa TaxID=714518 RepID=A0A978UAI6_ZIZJJ|nr:hypothetical protein FEM48_Zijuj12G0018900 [Ziziphus jujuba var. spinosa]
MEAEENFSSIQEGAPKLELTADILEAERRSSQTLVGKIITEKVIKKTTVLMITKRIWFTQESVSVEQLSPNIFLFAFRTKADQDRIHGLLLQFMNKDNAIKIGSLFKEVIRYEDSLRKSILGSKYLRIQKDGDEYGVWLLAEDGAFSVIHEGDGETNQTSEQDYPSTIVHDRSADQSTGEEEASAMATRDQSVVSHFSRGAEHCSEKRVMFDRSPKPREMLESSVDWLDKG